MGIKAMRGHRGGVMLGAQKIEKEVRVRERERTKERTKEEEKESEREERGGEDFVSVSLSLSFSPLTVYVSL